MKRNVFLGVDVGSISTNLVVIDEQHEILFETYARVGGNPIVSVQRALREVQVALGKLIHIAGVCTTGSARHLIGSVLGSDIVKNEITAHARAAIYLHPDVQTIFEIGGQDSKVTIVRNGVVVDFAMNLVCAAGTGSFLDSQASRLSMSVADLSEQAMFSAEPTSISGRCTVFCRSMVQSNFKSLTEVNFTPRLFGIFYIKAFKKHTLIFPIITFGTVFKNKSIISEDIKIFVYQKIFSLNIIMFIEEGGARVFSTELVFQCKDEITQIKGFKCFMYRFICGTR